MAVIPVICRVLHARQACAGKLIHGQVETFRRNHSSTFPTISEIVKHFLRHPTCQGAIHRRIDQTEKVISKLHRELKFDPRVNGLMEKVGRQYLTVHHHIM